MLYYNLLQQLGDEIASRGAEVDHVVRTSRSLQSSDQSALGRTSEIAHRYQTLKTRAKVCGNDDYILCKLF